MPTAAIMESPRVTVIEAVKDSTEFVSACAALSRGADGTGLLRFRLSDSLVSGLRDAAREAITRFGLHGWLSRSGRTVGSHYESLSLTYNQDLADPGVMDVHQSTLGSSVNEDGEFYYGQTHRFRSLKNTYFDTYGYRLLTPAAGIGALGKFLSECRLSPVRSRLSVLYGDQPESRSFISGWHRDEPVFENLRINIPLVTQRSYRLQLETLRDAPDEASTTMVEEHLATGYAYTFDTNRPHRVFARRACKTMRVHLVLGFSPWLRYDRKADRWEPNEHFGRTHPFDIVKSGGLHPALQAG